MDFQATKPVASVAATPAEMGKHANIKAPAAVETTRPAPVQPVGKEMTEELRATQAAVAEQLRDYLRTISRNLDFQVETESGTPVLTVRDASGNIVRKIPGEEAMQLMRRVNAQSGTLIDSIV